MKNLKYTIISLFLIVTLFSNTLIAFSNNTNSNVSIYAEFYDSNNDKVDGNSLIAGENYKMSILLSGQIELECVQLSATYDSSILENLVLASELSENSNYISQGSILNGQDFVIGYISLNSSQINKLTLCELTFSPSEDCDFEDVFDVSVNSNYTFVDSTSCSYSVNDENNKLLIDMSPTIENTIVLTGKTYVSLDNTGTKYGNEVSGISIVVNDIVVGTTDENGYFSVEVEYGTESVVFTCDSSVDREVYISGDKDINDMIVPITITDYNKDGLVTTVDKANFKTLMSKKTYSNFYDLNRDGIITSVDFTMLKLQVGNNICYSKLEYN